MGLVTRFKGAFKTSNAPQYPEELLAVLPHHDGPWYRQKHLLRLNLILLVPLLSSAAIGFDGAMMNGLQSLPQWRNTFGNPTGPLLGFMNAIYPVSKVIGLFPATWIGDRYGRRMAMLAGFLLLPIGAGLQGAAQNTPMFIVSRAVIGFSTSFLAQPSPILVTELAFPTHRAKLTAMYQTFFYLGAVLAAWSTYGTFRINSTWAWRIPSLLQEAFPLLQFFFFFWLPESPRWLVAHGRSEEARQIIVKHHVGGDQDAPLVNFEMAEISEGIRRSKADESSSSYLELFSTPANRKRSALAFGIAFFAQWNGASVMSYYLTLVLNTIGITEVSQQALINGMLQIFNWIVSVFGGALLVDRVGRRTLFLVATAGMTLSYVGWVALNAEFAKTHNQTLGNAVLVFIFIFYFFYDVAWTPLPIAYTAEIFPFGLRGRGMTFNYIGTYAGLIIGQFVNPIAMQNIGWMYYIVFCVLLALIFLSIYLWVVETKGHTLEEITEIFEGPRVPLNVVASEAKAIEVNEVEVSSNTKSSV